MNTLRQFSQNAVLRDGTLSLIRAIRSDDRKHLLNLFYRLSGQSIYFRFFGHKKGLTERDLKYLTEIDFDNHVAIAATVASKGEERIIGVGRYVQIDEKLPERIAELAFAVDEGHRRLGIGTILFEKIVTIAKEKGIEKLEADVLVDNIAMLKIFMNSGFKLKTNKLYGVEHIEFSIS